MSGPAPIPFLAVDQFAVGIIAIGQFAVGAIAIGQFASGGICIGQFAGGIVPIGLMGGVGVLWTAPAGVAAWGKGGVLRLAPVLTPPCVEPEAVSLAEVMAGRPGWVPVRFRADGALCAMESEAHVIKTPRRLLQSAAARAQLGQIDRAYAYAFRAGDMLACNKVSYVPTPAQRLPGFYARSLAKFALLVGICIAFREALWPLFG